MLSCYKSGGGCQNWKHSDTRRGGMCTPWRGWLLRALSFPLPPWFPLLEEESVVEEEASGVIVGVLRIRDRDLQVCEKSVHPGLANTKTV